MNIYEVRRREARKRAWVLAAVAVFMAGVAFTLGRHGCAFWCCAAASGCSFFVFLAFVQWNDAAVVEDCKHDDIEEHDGLLTCRECGRTAEAEGGEA